MKILDTKRIPTDKCVIPSNLPQYVINEKGDVTNENKTNINWESTNYLNTSQNH